MFVGKINFTSINENSRLQRRKQTGNITFTGTSKLNVPKSLLNNASQTGENVVTENNLWNKTLQSTRTLFEKGRQALVGEKNSETTVKPEVQKLSNSGKQENKTSQTDFTSIKGEPSKDSFAPKTFIFGENGKIVNYTGEIDPTIEKRVVKRNAFSKSCIEEYDQKTGNVLKQTQFWRDGKTVTCIDDYDPKTGIRLKHTDFHSDGKNVRYIFDYDPKTGGPVKLTNFTDDGKGIYEIFDYNPKTENPVKYTRFTLDRKNLQSLVDFDPITGKRVKETSFYSDGITPFNIYYCDPKTGNQIKRIAINKNGKHEFINDYDPETGKIVKITQYSKDTINREYVTDYDSKTGKIVRNIDFDEHDRACYISDYDLKTGKKIRATILKNDGKTIDYIFDYAPETGKKIKWTTFKKDGKTVDFVLDYDPVTENAVKRTNFNTDGSVKDVLDFIY